MGERRNRKSFWNPEDETSRLSGMSEHNSWTEKERHYRNPSGRYREFSASGTSSGPKSRDHSGWSSWESMEENPVVPMSGSSVKSRLSTAEGKEIGGGNRYRTAYTEFDGMDRRNYDQSLENDRINSYRYVSRGRSRSRSRSRTRGRSRSRSLSRSRGKERGRGWSRSRSRSRSDGSARGQTRSRSPLGYRRQPYGWSDRKGGPDKSSVICRDFPSGRCRRGSECRFLHPDNTSQRDVDFAEDGPPESWRERPDPGRIPKHAYSRGPGFELRDDDVSDRYHGEDERFPRKSRSAIPCKDLMKGNCRWGDSCRFSHHLCSDNSFGKSNRNASFDEDIERQANKNGRPLCKYFAAGKCGRDNCRFSHDDPKLSHVEDGRGTDRRRSHDKIDGWDGPKWDDAPRVSDTVKTTGWGEAYETNPSNTVETTLNNGKGDDKWAHRLGTDSGSPDLPEWTGNPLNREKQPSPARESGTYRGDIDMTESIDKENMVNRQEQLLLHHSEVQNQDRVSNIRGQNSLLEDHSFSVKPLQLNLSTASHIPQQHRGVAENDLVKSFGSDVLQDANTANMTRPVVFSGADLNQNGETMISGNSSVSSEKDRVANMLFTRASNEFRTDLNGPENHTVAPLNMQAMQNHGVTVQSPRPQFFPNLLTSQQSTQMTNPPVLITGQQVPSPRVILNHMFVNEQSQNFAGIEVPNPMGAIPSISPKSGHVPIVNAINAQPVPVTRDLFNPLGNGRDTSEPVNDTLAQPSPAVVPTEFDISTVKHRESPKLKQEGIVVNSEVTGGINGNGGQSKGVQETKPLDGQGKVEEAGANKDEKGMRMLKNALIELVKELLKPKWKEGRMSREAHKTIVKKVVDKVTSTIPVEHIPKTQDKVELYLTSSKPKISKLVQAYVERCQKTDA